MDKEHTDQVVAALSDAGQRLDLFLATRIDRFSRARIQALIRSGHVLLNGSTCRPKQIIRAGDNIEVSEPELEPILLQPESLPVPVLFEDEHILVVNKPAGMVVHPSAGHASGTLVNAMLGYDPDIEGIGGEERPGIVHRLDKETSGLILLAKNERAHRWLQDQFRLRKVEKIYLALVDGKPPTPSGRVEAYIGRDPSHRKRMAIVPESRGRESISEYKTVESFTNHTLLEFHPLTGRTHQIRLHCAFLGCPIVGDEVYGRKKSSVAINRHFLHAYRLKIILPGEKEPRNFEAALPDELEFVLTSLRA